MKGLTGFSSVFGLDPLREEKEQKDSLLKVSSTTDTFSGLSSIYHDGVDTLHYNDAVQLARDYLLDWHGDYIFFQDSNTTTSADYVLIKGDILRDGRSLTISGEGVLIRYSNQRYSQNSQSTLGGDINFPSLSITDGSGSSASSPSHSEHFTYKAVVPHSYWNLTTQFTYKTFEDYSVTLDNSDFYYSSFADTPHLVERSGVNLLACISFILAVFCCTMFFVAIFRNVQRR